MLALASLPNAAHSETYVQTNLVSSVSGLAAVTDTSLINPWGVSFSATSPFWVSDQGTNLSTLYSGAGVKNTSTIVSVPNPTGQVFTSASGFVEPGGTTAATFTFATLGGAIYAWNPANGNTAQLAASTSGAVYTGLALASNGTASFLYAANVSAGTIDAFNSNFSHVTLSGSFVDPNLPAGYVPYNIQNVNGMLYVEYEKPGVTSLGAGVVSVFDANGNFQKELISAGGRLDVPWGIVVAPAGFGAFANDLLVGNFGNGEINAFDPVTGAFIGALSNASGNPIVNTGLWDLSTRTGAGFDPNAVYFTAGIDNETQGLFGTITAAPEPVSFTISGLGLLTLALFAHCKRRSA
jgi:uncharacterized protein (TIGR03118 family)